MISMIFIYDRNLLDLTTAKDLVSKIQSNGFSSLSDFEKEQWQSGLKGTLNYTDLNRIEGNSWEIAQIFDIPIGSVKTDWKMTDIPTRKDYQRIRDNVQKIRSSAIIRSDTPVTPELPLNRYEKINDIEKILFDVYDLYTRNNTIIYYIDELYDEEDYWEIKSERDIEYIDEIYADEKIGVI